MDKKTRLITQILNGEYLMFLRIPGQYPVTSQQSEKGFRLARGSAFQSWSEDTLKSYARDIAEAMHCGRNFMTEKYARMDNLIPPINTNPIIDKIVSIEVKWQNELRNKYPRFFAASQGTASQGPDFAIYLRSEIETYSDATIESYYNDVSKALTAGRSLAEERYQLMVKALGYESIDDYERKAQEKAN